MTRPISLVPQDSAPLERPYLRLPGSATVRVLKKYVLLKHALDASLAVTMSIDFNDAAVVLEDAAAVEAVSAQYWDPGTPLVLDYSVRTALDST